MKIMIIVTHLDAFKESSEDNEQSNTCWKEQKFRYNIWHMIII